MSIWAGYGTAIGLMMTVPIASALRRARAMKRIAQADNTTKSCSPEVALAAKIEHSKSSQRLDDSQQAEFVQLARGNNWTAGPTVETSASGRRKRVNQNKALTPLDPEGRMYTLPMRVAMPGAFGPAAFCLAITLTIQFVGCGQESVSKRAAPEEAAVESCDSAQLRLIAKKHRRRMESWIPSEGRS